MPRSERPLDAGDGVLIRFAADLRRLREKAGGPTYREMAGRAHYSVASLSDAAGGRKLPTLAVTIAYVRACDGDVDEWERRWRASAAEISGAARAAPLPDAALAPYVGLATFQPTDTDRFFGRERLVDDLLGRLSTQRFVAVFGASGAGKSSILRAGLLARLRQDPRHRAVLFTPGGHPLEECAIRLATATGMPPGRLYADFAAEPRNLYRSVRQALADEPADTDLVLVVDQFEEIFTLCREPTERAAFIAALVTAATADGGRGRCRVVLGVRADFYAHCTNHPELVEAFRDAQVTVGPMTVDELRRAITMPATRAGYILESGLVATVVAQAHGRSGVLPLLSHALQETWRRRHGMTLTLNGFHAAGGVDGALAQTAETVYTQMDAGRRILTRNLFLRLTALGDGTEDAKRRVVHDELDRADPDTAAVLDRLTTARLITADRTGVEIAHEAIIRCWPRLREWLAEDREGFRVHRQLTEAAEAWHSLHRDPGSLYRGTRLARARDWSYTGGDALAVREREFLDASVDAEIAERASARRHTRRLRQLVGLLTVLLVLAGTAVLYADRTRHTAFRQRNIAVAERAAGQAAALRTADPTVAAQLGLAAFRLAATRLTRSTLLSTFATPYATRLTGHTGNIDRVTVSADGRRLATASQDHTVQLWDVGDPHHPGRSATITQHADAVTAVAFSPDGRTLVTASRDRTVRLWDVTDLGHPHQRAALTDQPRTVYGVAFSPDGHVLATAGEDRTILLWQVDGPDGPERLATLVGHSDIVLSVAFSPDGRTMASASWDGTARLWDVRDPRRPHQVSVLSGHAGPVVWVDYDPAGRTLATAGGDHTARLWDVTDPRHPGQLCALTGHTDVVRSVDFGPGGTSLATVSADGTARLWNIADPRRPDEVAVLPGHHDAVVSVAFLPNGRSLATASDDDTVRLWDIPGPVITGHRSSVYGVAFSPDGRELASASYDRSARLWSVADPYHPGEVRVLSAHGDAVNSAVFGPNQRIVATASADHTVRLWDGGGERGASSLSTLDGNTDAVNALAFAPDGRILATADHTVRLWNVADPTHPVALSVLAGHSGRVDSVAFSPDGRTLATAGTDHTARLWDVTDPARPTARRTLAGHTDAVKSVAFSPDGRTVATAGADRTVRLWGLTGGASTVITGHTDTVYAVAFSPDGHTLATASADRTARLWNITDPAHPDESAVLAGHQDRVDAVAFSPDGNTLATGSIDHTARLWELDPARVAARICADANMPIPRSDWGRYFPGLPYRPPCTSGT